MKMAAKVMSPPPRSGRCTNGAAGAIAECCCSSAINRSSTSRAPAVIAVRCLVTASRGGASRLSTVIAERGLLRMRCRSHKSCGGNARY
jgi:hypothetical protein